MYNFRLSFIGIVIKKDRGWCLIYYLLFFEGSSVIDFIDLDYCMVYIVLFVEVLEMIVIFNLGIDFFFVKMDVKLVFCLLFVYLVD